MGVVEASDVFSGPGRISEARTTEPGLKDDVRRVLAGVRHLKPSSQQGVLKTVSGPLLLALRRRYISRNPAANLEPHELLDGLAAVRPDGASDGGHLCDAERPNHSGRPPPAAEPPPR